MYCVQCIIYNLKKSTPKVLMLPGFAFALPATHTKTAMYWYTGVVPGTEDRMVAPCISFVN
jgi:hypothetical protein